MAFLEPVESRKSLRGQLTMPAVWLAVTGIGIFLHPDPHGHGTHQQLGLPPCPSVLLFNRPCPGCGLTTSWTSTIHGQWIGAFKAHPIGPILYLLFTVAAIFNLYAYWRRLRIDTNTPRWNWGLGIGAFLFFLFGLTRFFLTPNFGSDEEFFRAYRRFGVPISSTPTPNSNRQAPK